MGFETKSPSRVATFELVFKTTHNTYLIYSNVNLFFVSHETPLIIALMKPVISYYWAVNHNTANKYRLYVHIPYYCVLSYPNSPKNWSRSQWCDSDNPNKKSKRRTSTHVVRRMLTQTRTYTHANDAKTRAQLFECVICRVVSPCSLSVLLRGELAKMLLFVIGHLYVYVCVFI